MNGVEAVRLMWDVAASMTGFLAFVAVVLLGFGLLRRI